MRELGDFEMGSYTMSKEEITASNQMISANAMVLQAERKSDAQLKKAGKTISRLVAEYPELFGY